MAAYRSNKKYIGIDPGKGGGLASMSDSGSIKVYNCPDSVYEMSRILYSCKKLF